VQDHVLNLLFGMLINMPPENTDDSAKILKYFENQLANLRDFYCKSSAVYGNVEVSEKELQARSSILTCTQDCLLEIQRCRETEKWDSSGWREVAEAHSRAAQAASILKVIMDTNGSLMHIACEAGGLKVAKRLFLLSGPDGFHVRNARGETPLSVAFREGHFDVANWLVLQGACNTADGHVDSDLLFSDVPRKDLLVLRASLDRCIQEHRSFSVVLGAATLSAKTNASYPKSPLNHLAHDMMKLEVIADFVGVVRGRQLRNAREALRAIVAHSGGGGAAADDDDA